MNRHDALRALGWIPLSEAASMLGVHAETIRRWVRAGSLRAHRDGHHLWVPLAEIQKRFPPEAATEPEAP